MKREIIMGEINDTLNKEAYIQKALPNWRQLADILEKAKGPNRSMGQFAEACQISPATFTRIVRGYYKKALTYEMLEAIVKNADADAEITMQAAMKANGYVLPGDVIEEPADSYDEKKEVSQYSLSTDLFGIITKELENRGYACMAFSRGFETEDAPKSDLFFDVFDKKEHITEFTLRISGIEPKYRKFCGCFINESSKKAAETDDEIVMRTLISYGIFFIRDMWDADSSRDIMYSLVFSDAHKFEVFERALRDVKINNHMSLILIDKASEKVIKETMINRVSGSTMTSLFDSPYVNNSENNPY